MLDIVAADEDQAPASVDRRRIDHREPRLASARCGIAQPLAAEAAHQPQGQRQQAEHHDEGEQHLETILSLAE